MMGGPERLGIAALDKNILPDRSVWSQEVLRYPTVLCSPILPSVSVSLSLLATMRIALVTFATAMVCLTGIQGDIQPQRDFNLQRVSATAASFFPGYNRAGARSHRTISITCPVMITNANARLVSVLPGWFHL